MKKKFSLILIYLISAAGGIAVAENFESLDAILSTVRDANRAKEKHQTDQHREKRHRDRRHDKREKEKHRRDAPVQPRSGWISSPRG